MIPNIFISSTILDLGHLRDSIRDLIIEIGYNPIMSEYGDIGFLPTTNAENSCYYALRDCQLAVFIIGKRYGSTSVDDISITHKEFRTAKDKKIPIIFLINEEVQSFKRVYDVNQRNELLEFPEMEEPGKIFNLINEFSSSELNNGFVTFSNVQSAKQNLKKQLSHIVGDLLTKQYDPVKGEIKDILSEITTLRHMLLEGKAEFARKFSSAFRFLLNEENKFLKEIAETISGSLEAGVPELIESKDFKSYLANKKIETKIIDTKEAAKLISDEKVFQEGIVNICLSSLPHSTLKSSLKGMSPAYDIQPDDPKEPKVAFAYGKTKFWSNPNADKLLNAMFDRLIANTK